MKSPRWLLGGFFVLLLAASVFGQTNSRPAAYPPDGPIAASLIASPSSIGGGAGHGVRSVKGSPFSADVAYEFTQMLGNDNRIHRESHGRIFRDAEGRIRNELADNISWTVGPSVMIDGPGFTIYDPVSQTSASLYPQSKTALVSHIMVQRDEAGREIGIGSLAGGDSAAEPRRRADHLEKLDGLQKAQGSAPAGMQRKSIGGTREELGAKEIEGFTANGIRYSNTKAAGEIGNEKPIVTVEETWWSEDLKAVVMSIYDHPQTGRSVMRLTNIRAGEPDPLLFQIPLDYTVHEYPSKPKPAGKPPQ